MRRFVALQSALYESGDVEQATAVPSGYFGKVEANRAVLFGTISTARGGRRVGRDRCLERRRDVLRFVMAAAVTSGARRRSTSGNSVDPETREPTVKPVRLLEPNPWGLWDVYGNVKE